MSIELIEAAIPHRSPMLLVDEIVEQSEESIVCRKTFREDEYFVQGHFPDRPIVPGVIHCECVMQAGAILLSGLAEQPEGSVPVATRLDNVKFKRIVQPGDSVELHVTLKERLANAFFMAGKVTVDGKLATRLDFACTVTTPGESGNE